MIFLKHKKDIEHSQEPNYGVIVSCLLLQAMHSFSAETEKELSLEVGDYVVVRTVMSCQ